MTDPQDEKVAFYLAKAKKAQECAAVAENSGVRESYLAASHSWVALAVEAQERFHYKWRPRKQHKPAKAPAH